MVGHAVNKPCNKSCVSTCATSASCRSCILYQVGLITMFPR